MMSLVVGVLVLWKEVLSGVIGCHLGVTIKRCWCHVGCHNMQEVQTSHQGQPLGLFPKVPVRQWILGKKRSRVLICVWHAGDVERGVSTATELLATGFEGVASTLSG